MRKKKINLFSDLRESLQGALAFERGESVDLRVAELPSAPAQMRSKEIPELRSSFVECLRKNTADID